MNLQDETYLKLVQLKLSLFEDELNGQTFVNEVMKVREAFLVDFTVKDFEKLYEQSEEEYQYILNNLQRQKAP